MTESLSMDDLAAYAVDSVGWSPIESAEWDRRASDMPVDNIGFAVQVVAMARPLTPPHIVRPRTPPSDVLRANHANPPNVYEEHRQATLLAIAGLRHYRRQPGTVGVRLFNTPQDPQEERTNGA